MEWLKQRFELSRGGDAHNVRPMEGLRGFAVFLVFLVHYVTLVKPWVAHAYPLLVPARALHAMGNTGVDLFFVLSGYLIYGSLISRPQHFMRFMSRRVERIYPAFLAVFVLYIALSFAFPAHSKIPAPASDAMLYLLQNVLLLPGLFAIEPLITVAWSLSYEMFFYLAIPVVIGLFRLRERSAAWRIAFFSVVTALAAVWCALFGGHIRLIMFLSGMLLHEAVNNLKLRAPNGFAGASALAVGLLGTLLLPVSGGVGIVLKVVILFASFFVLCLVCFRAPSGRLPRAFSWTPARWLGNMSYSYYLLHGLALQAAFLALALVLPVADHGAWLFWLLMPLMFALTLVPTAILFLAIERPFSLAPRRAASKAAQPALSHPTQKAA